MLTARSSRRRARRLLVTVGVVIGCLGLAAPPLADAALPGPARPASATADARMASEPIGHVFVIVLENESYQDTYVHNPHRYLGRTLQREGTLLTHYYAIGHYSLDNYIAMISGQAPNPATSADCQRYTNFHASSHPVKINRYGQAAGTGCVYPRRVRTLGDQLSANAVSWAGFMDEMGRNPSREQASCGVPHLTNGRADDTQTATKKDQYAARHNPFVYFHSLIDSGRCKRHVVPLGRLGPDLQQVATTPRFSFITPDLCDDGHDSPCAGPDVAGSRAGGLASVDHFLKHYIPMIKASPAYRQDGLIIVTSDESEPGDAASCCGERPGPTEKKPGLSGPGGGRIGTLAIGRCVAPGAKDPTAYNHYSLLRSLEDLYGVTAGGADGHGHLGYAGAAGLKPFGSDLFSTC